MPLYMNLFVFILCSLFIGFFANRASGVEEQAFYVSPSGNDQSAGDRTDRPFATVERAQEAVRAWKQKTGGRPVTVYLRGGEYLMEKPLMFTPADSGTAQCPVMYKAYRDERPVICGGRKISGWKPYKDGIWMAEVPAAKEGTWVFRQFYINGGERRQARFPNEGFYRVAGLPDGGKEVAYSTPAKRFVFAPGEMDASWSNLQDIEVIVYHFWTDVHLKVAGIDSQSNMVTFQNASRRRLTEGHGDENARYIVENVFEGLDSYGEWFLNRSTGVVYYMPYPGEDMTKAEAVAPVSEGLIRMEGNWQTQEWVEHVRFENLSFQAAHWDLPAGEANDSQAAVAAPGAIVMCAARNCEFRNCEVSNVGMYAFELRDGCRGNRFEANEVHHVAAGGWRINGGTEKAPPLSRTGENVISDNRLHHYGTVYPAAVGMLLMNTFGNRVAHNHIHDGYYTGISVGWVWGYGPSVSRDNIIEYNQIHDIGKEVLSDMGGIYMLGVAPGTVVRNNLIHHVDAKEYGGWGIYNDEGSTHVLVENNIVYKTMYAGYFIHYAKEITVRNNILAMGLKSQLGRGRREKHIAMFFENNIVYWTGGDLLERNWSDKPYEYDFGGGPVTVNSTFEMDWNVYFNPKLKVDEVKFEDQETWTDWQKRGKDVHSVYADPMFEDVMNYDFRLKAGSPALAMGFQPIDMSTVGPRGKVGPNN